MVEKGYQNQRLEKEFVAEFPDSPGKCGNTCRIVALPKEVSVSKGQQKLFDGSQYFFCITNVPKEERAAEEIVFGANKRCDQDKIISQLKAWEHSRRHCMRRSVMGPAWPWRPRVEPEVLAGSVPEGDRASKTEGEASGREASAHPHGLRQISAGADFDTNSDYTHSTASDPSPSGMVRVTRYFLPVS